MLLSLALIFLVGLSVADICQKIKLPRIVGMLLAGIVLGPYVLDFFDANILNISGDLRKFALIIILLKAGLSLNISDLKQVGRPAFLMSFIPASFEILAYLVLAPYIFGITKTEALVMGAVLAAVSPAVVVPKMISLIENNYGTKKGIPQLILAGASCDDIFVIVLFSTFLGQAQGIGLDMTIFLDLPISIGLGVLIGALTGFALNMFFERSHKLNQTIRNSTKIIIILGFAFLLISLENFIKISLSGLLAVVSMGLVIKLKSTDSVSKRLSQKFGKLWIAAELILFVLVGASVDIGYLSNAIIPATLIIFIALIIRSIGVVVCLLGTKLNFKERLFCVISYLPKATVQAAIGSIPLSLGLPCGSIVLTVAVLSIIITAPLGAIGIDASYKKLLIKENN